MEQHTSADLFGKNLVSHISLSNREIEKAYAGSAGEGLDSEGSAAPDAVFIDLYTAMVSVPSIGRNLLDQESWDKLAWRLEKGDHAILVMWGGRYTITPEDFTPGTSPERLVLKQGGLPIEMRDLDIALRLADGTPVNPDNIKVFRIISQTGLDLSKPLDFFINVKREKGMVYPEIIRQSFPYTLTVPERFYDVPAGDNKTWVSIWQQRAVEIGILGAALLADGQCAPLHRDSRELLAVHFIFHWLVRTRPTLDRQHDGRVAVTQRGAQLVLFLV
jgi:transcriptional regulator of nitric oxide reductase